MCALNFSHQFYDINFIGQYENSNYMNKILFEEFQKYNIIFNAEILLIEN